MIIGVPKEIKKGEYRVGITPSGVEELRRDKYIILIEAGAGEGATFPMVNIKKQVEILLKERKSSRRRNSL
ncbi:MAG: hypothetical protein HXY47_02405 [Nitrospirae bacterium]|nr:hypothetical protein [Nitrospirota bacterium]